jgi:PAS domain S-box-containing protein
LTALDTIAEALIALSFFVVFGALMVVARRRDLPFRPIYILFAVCILASGTTYLLAAATPWVQEYSLGTAVRTVAALTAVATAAALVRLAPRAMAIPGPEDLQKLNARLAEFTEALDKAQTIIQKLDGTIVFWNSGAEALYGWSRTEAVGRKSHELLQSELPQPFVAIQAALLEHGHWTGEFLQRCRNGSPIWVASHWILHRNAAGEPVSVVKVNNNITELKRVSEALRGSEASARSLFENASQGILTVTPGGRIANANAMVQTLFGYSHDELEGSPVEMLLPERLRQKHAGYRAAFAQHPHARPMGQGMDLVARRKDGVEFPVEISLSYVPEPHGGLTMAFISDITARRQANRRLEAALAEKTVLLKEVHHRVKNNLAVIAGLLGMQADALADERAKVALGESQQRVLSMALIHEYLYATEHLDRVNFGEYVEQLANELRTTYAMESDLVEMVIRAENIDLPVHRAIPAGLILNELLSNALKYAFPDGRSGAIHVSFSQWESGELSLVVSDNGVGMPEDFDWRNSNSLGLRIVRILTKQIDGTLALDRAGEGTRFELRFVGRQFGI